MGMSAGNLGCTSLKKNVEKDQNEKNSADEENELQEYRLGTGDVLEIQIYKEPDCSGEISVDKSGNISFCYVENFFVAGKSLKEVEKDLKELLKRDYIKNPKLSVEVSKFRGLGTDKGWVKDSIRIIGEVNSPGIYTLKTGYSVLDVILEAGGFTEFASPNRTRIVRWENGDKTELRVRVKDLMKTGDRDPDAMLKAGDTIIIPEGII